MADDQLVNDLRHAERVLFNLLERIAAAEDLLRELQERHRILNALGQG
jgi:hypothetical protein